MDDNARIPASVAPWHHALIRRLRTLPSTPQSSIFPCFVIAARHHVMADRGLPNSRCCTKCRATLFHFLHNKERRGHGSPRLAKLGDLREDPRSRRRRSCLGISSLQPRLPTCLRGLGSRVDRHRSGNFGSPLGAFFSQQIPRSRPASSQSSGRRPLRRLSSPLFLPLPTALASSVSVISLVL